MPTGGIGDRSGAGVERLRPSQVPSLKLTKTPFEEMQAEVGKARIIEAANLYLKDLGAFEEQNFSFGLSFGLDW